MEKTHVESLAASIHEKLLGQKFGSLNYLFTTLHGKGGCAYVRKEDLVAALNILVAQGKLKTVFCDGGQYMGIGHYLEFVECAGK